MPGTELGALRSDLSERAGLGSVKVVAPPSHDTASAVAGVPTANTGKANWAYLSSGHLVPDGHRGRASLTDLSHGRTQPDELKAGWMAPTGC